MFPISSTSNRTIVFVSVRFRLTRLALIGLCITGSLNASVRAQTSTDSNVQDTKRVLLLGQSPDGHPVTTHEYMAGQRIVKKLLEPYKSLDVSIVVADEPWSDGPDLLREVDVCVLFLSEGARWMNADTRRYQAFAELAQRKGGLIGLHWAVGTKEAKNIAPFVELLGACHGGPDRKHGVFETRLVPALNEHSIARGIQSIEVKEEFYYSLKRTTESQGIEPVMLASIDGKNETVAWAWKRPDGGRSFGFTGLHFHDNWKHETYRRLVIQGILWVCEVEIPEDGVAVSIDKELLKLQTIQSDDSN